MPSLPKTYFARAPQASDAEFLAKISEAEKKRFLALNQKEVELACKEGYGCAIDDQRGSLSAICLVKIDSHSGAIGCPPASPPAPTAIMQGFYVRRNHRYRGLGYFAARLAAVVYAAKSLSKDLQLLPPLVAPIAKLSQAALRAMMRVGMTPYSNESELESNEHLKLCSEALCRQHQDDWAKVAPSILAMDMRKILQHARLANVALQRLVYDPIYGVSYRFFDNSEDGALGKAINHLAFETPSYKARLDLAGPFDVPDIFYRRSRVA